MYFIIIIFLFPGAESHGSLMINCFSNNAIFKHNNCCFYFSTRFPDMFPAVLQVRELQMELDKVIQAGVPHITRLILLEEQLERKFCLW